MAMQTDRGVPLSTLAPKFLHTNSTSHTWPFSAIAELIDNAYDPDVNAKQFWIDKTVLKGDECLTFMDNGNGLDKQSMHKMLSFGYSDKVAVNGLEPIGIYGNGFKSGSMRLGKDAIVFSKSTNTSCVGMLSQTYLEKIDAKQIIVPIVCFEEGENNKYLMLGSEQLAFLSSSKDGNARITVREEHKASLQDILRYSPFNTQEELLAEINTISSPWSTKKTGTRIIIWNLRRTSLDMAEFDFKKDRYDIRMPSELYDMMNGSYTNTDRATSHTPETLFSLRAYCSILYLKPRMQIMVRGQKVKSQLIAKSLAYIRKDHYKPQVLNGKRIAITFGYNTKSKDQYGIMMYHKNRLIKAYERVGCQLKADHRGVGVIGVIECNFLEPTHNKQSFLESDKYRKTITSVGIKLEEYWHEIRYRKTKENPNSTIPVEDTMKRPDQNWVQCDSCLQWRKLPDGIDCGKLPEKWFCRMNPDPQFRSCQVQEEAEDSDDDQPSYRKTYRDQEKVNKRIHISELKAVEEKKRRESQKPATPPETVRRQLQLIHLKKALHPSTSYLPSTPTTSSTSLQGGATRPDFTPQIVTLSQAAHSPSGSHGLPVISNVCSLSMTPQSAKRQNLVTPPTSKRPRLNGRHSGSPDTPASVNSPGSPFVPVVSDTDTDETDDDLVILETASTPKPQQSVDGKKVKTEKEKSEAPVDMLWECVDDADTSGTNVAGTSCARSTAGGATPSTVSSTTTQTEVPKLKEEKLSQSDERATTSTSGNNNIGQKCHLDPNNVAPIVVKQENHENGLSEFQRGYSSQTTDDPVNLSNIVELQKQQDQLMELMEDTAKERDALKEQVHQLTSKLQSMEGSFSAGVKKEHSHQFTQTEETEEYRSLPEVKQEVGESNLVKKATDNEADSSPGHSEERDVDISLQVESLIEDLDELRKKKDKLLAQVESLQKKKATMVAQCEELEMSLQEDQEEETAALLPRYSSVQPPSEEEGGSTSAGTVSTKDAFESLIELRHNIGRILVKVVPELDLGQVNYQCNVIDEMLEGLVNNQDSFLSLVKTLNANDT